MDYPLTDVLQMIGRAGRPGYSKQGVAVVMVAQEKKAFYKRFLYSPFPVESCLQPRLEVNINAEIAGSTINNLSDAVGYLSWTYYFRRVQKNPSYYDAPIDGAKDKFEPYFYEVMKETITRLEEHKCVKVDREYDDWQLSTTVLGCTASLFYLDYRTPLQMESSVHVFQKSIVEFSTSIHPSANQSFRKLELSIFDRAIMSIAWTHEFDDLPVRHNEEESNARLFAALKLGPSVLSLLREFFSLMNASDSDIMGDPHTKCYLLVQAYLSKTPLPVSDYVNDTKSVLDQLPRLVGAMQYIVQSSPDRNGSFDVFCMLAKVKQSLKSRSALDYDPLLQIPFMTKSGASILETRGIKFHEIFRSDSLAVGDILKEVIPNVSDRKKAVSFVRSVPIVSVGKATISQSREITDGKYTRKCKIDLHVIAGNGGKRMADDGHINLSVSIGLPLRQLLLGHRSVRLTCEKKTFTKTIEIHLDWNFAISDADVQGRFSLSVIREDIRGLDLQQQIEMQRVEEN